MTDEIKNKLKRIIKESVTSSTARSQPSGTVGVTHKFLSEIDLFEIDVAFTDGKYQEFLDNKTNLLAQRLPSKSWGHARKFLNIFLLKIEDSFLLAKEMKSHNKIKLQLEVPLDGKVGKKLVELNPNLPKWVKIQSVTSEINQKYQSYAKELANSKGTSRIALDDIFWTS
jgi:hypothetical protein